MITRKLKTARMIKSVTQRRGRRALSTLKRVEHPARVGKYEIEEFLGGGMSQVYRARDSVLGRQVALKILTGASATDVGSKARFLFEARTASNIRHENVISIYDFGEDQGRPYIVMEFLEGESLRDAIRNGTLGDFEHRMNIALQIARAVKHIHTKKIIHRDLKPENIHIDPAGKAMLMDFGIAKSEGAQAAGDGTTVGTPFYMSPEQVLGQTLTRQSDVYSFGVLLFELLTGAKPATGDTAERIFHQILYDPVNLAPIRALQIPPNLSDEVGQLIERCTVKQPAQRLHGFGEVCAEIEWILNPALPAPPPPEPVPTKVSPPFIERLPPVFQSQTGLILLAAAAALLGTSLISFAILYLRTLWK
jgi:eukaryotic-like serine/threonine-protein kinase